MLLKVAVEPDWDASDYTDKLRPGSLWIDKTGAIYQLHCTFEKGIPTPLYIVVRIDNKIGCINNSTCSWGLHKNPESAFGGSFSSFKPFYGKVTIESKRQ